MSYERVRSDIEGMKQSPRPRRKRRNRVSNLRLRRRSHDFIPHSFSGCCAQDIKRAEATGLEAVEPSGTCTRRVGEEDKKMKGVGSDDEQPCLIVSRILEDENYEVKPAAAAKQRTLKEGGSTW
jgi:hypothetical protein